PAPPALERVLSRAVFIRPWRSGSRGSRGVEAHDPDDPVLDLLRRPLVESAREDRELDPSPRLLQPHPARERRDVVERSRLRADPDLGEAVLERSPAARRERIAERRSP